MAGRRSDFAYWAGVAMAIACVAFVFIQHTFLFRMELGGIPLVWLAGGAAILSILVHELLDSVAASSPRARVRQRESKTRAGVSPAAKRARDIALPPGAGPDRGFTSRDFDR